jgi:hypothetical protein
MRSKGFKLSPSPGQRVTRALDLIKGILKGGTQGTKNELKKHIEAGGKFGQKSAHDALSSFLGKG